MQRSISASDRGDRRCLLLFATNQLVSCRTDKGNYEFFSVRIGRCTITHLRISRVLKSHTNTNQEHPSNSQRRGLNRLCRNRHWQDGRLSPPHHSEPQHKNASRRSRARACANARTRTPDPKKLRRTQSPEGQPERSRNGRREYQDTNRRNTSQANDCDCYTWSLDGPERTWRDRSFDCRSPCTG